MPLNTLQNSLGAHAAPNDFNGDGLSDILFYGGTGLQLVYATASSGFVSSSATLWMTTSNFVGTGDFNGDGREDVLVHGGSSTGFGSSLISALQTISAGFQPDYEAVAQLPGGWTPLATADFNGDHKTDILLRSTDGTLTNWLSSPPDATIVDVPDAPFVPNPKAVYGVPLEWHVVATADFNGDGRSDILWRNDDGTFTDWLAQADGSFVSNPYYVNPDHSWHLSTTGDFNGDGRTDLLWQKDDGTITDWFGQTDGSFVSNPWYVNPDHSWHVAGTGDYNGDNRTDLLWQKDDGTITDWFGQVDGSFVSNPSYLNLGAAFHVLPQGVHDLIG